MKLIIFTLLALATFTTGAFAQGTVTFDNLDNNLNTPDPNATSGGFVYICEGQDVLLNQDVNLTLLGGASPTTLVQIASLTFAAGTAQGDYTFLLIPGVFIDPSGTIYSLPGVPLNGTGYVQIEGWLGNAPSYDLAIAEGGIFGESPVYQTITGGGRVNGNPPNNPVSIGDAMPSWEVGDCPEPGTLAFFGLGAASLLLFRHRRKQ